MMATGSREKLKNMILAFLVVASIPLSYFVWNTFPDPFAATHQLVLRKIPAPTNSSSSIDVPVDLIMLTDGQARVSYGGMPGFRAFWQGLRALLADATPLLFPSSAGALNATVSVAKDAVVIDAPPTLSVTTYVAPLAEQAFGQLRAAKLVMTFDPSRVYVVYPNGQVDRLFLSQQPGQEQPLIHLSQSVVYEHAWPATPVSAAQHGLVAAFRPVGRVTMAVAKWGSTPSLGALTDVFFSDPSAVRVVREAAGTVLLTDGYTGVRVYHDGRIEYENPGSVQGPETERESVAGVESFLAHIAPSTRVLTGLNVRNPRSVDRSELSTMTLTPYVAGHPVVGRDSSDVVVISGGEVRRFTGSIRSILATTSTDVLADPSVALGQLPVSWSADLTVTEVLPVYWSNKGSAPVPTWAAVLSDGETWVLASGRWQMLS